MPKGNILIVRKLRFHQKAALVVLLILPALALTHLAWVQIGTLYALAGVVAYAMIISIVSYRSCLFDKDKAQMKQWRTPEASLHFLEMIGGWPGSFISQRRYRHKISKTDYQVSFWIIVIIHQAASLEYLLDWPFVQFVMSQQ